MTRLSAGLMGCTCAESMVDGSGAWERLAGLVVPAGVPGQWNVLVS